MLEMRKYNKNIYFALTCLKTPLLPLYWHDLQKEWIHAEALYVCMLVQRRWNMIKPFSFIHSGVVGPELMSSNVSVFITSDAGNTWREVRYHNCIQTTKSFLFRDEPTSLNAPGLNSSLIKYRRSLTKMWLKPENICSKTKHSIARCSYLHQV